MHFDTIRLSFTLFRMICNRFGSYNTIPFSKDSIGERKREIEQQQPSATFDYLWPFNYKTMKIFGDFCCWSSNLHRLHHPALVLVHALWDGFRTCLNFYQHRQIWYFLSYICSVVARIRFAKISRTRDFARFSPSVKCWQCL